MRERYKTILLFQIKFDLPDEFRLQVVHRNPL